MITVSASILKRNATAIVGILGVVATLLAAFLSYRSLPDYRISYNSGEFNSFLSKDSDLKNLNFLIDDKQISELYNCHINIRNIGNRPITPEDIVSPISLDITNKSIIGFSITENPNVLKLLVDNNNKTLFIAKENFFDESGR